jgi:hypothetical protein
VCCHDAHQFLCARSDPLTGAAVPNAPTSHGLGSTHASGSGWLPAVLQLAAHCAGPIPAVPSIPQNTTFCAQNQKLAMPIKILRGKYKERPPPVAQHNSCLPAHSLPLSPICAGAHAAQVSQRGRPLCNLLKLSSAGTAACPHMAVASVAHCSCSVATTS